MAGIPVGFQPDELLHVFRMQHEATFELPPWTLGLALVRG